MKYTAYVWNDFNRYAVGADPVIIKDIEYSARSKVEGWSFTTSSGKEIALPPTVVIEFHKQKEE